MPRQARSGASASSGFAFAERAGTRSWCCSATSCCTRRGWCPRRTAAQAGRRSAAGRADDARSPPHPRHRHRAAARQDQIPAGRVRADAARASPCCSCSARSRRWPGRRLHKQNFRRLIEQQGLVEETGARLDRDRRPAGQALPLPPRGAARARRRRHQAAARPLGAENAVRLRGKPDPRGAARSVASRRVAPVLLLPSLETQR